LPTGHVLFWTFCRTIASRQISYESNSPRRSGTVRRQIDNRGIGEVNGTSWKSTIYFPLIGEKLVIWIVDRTGLNKNQEHKYRVFHSKQRIYCLNSNFAGQSYIIYHFRSRIMVQMKSSINFYKNFVPSVYPIPLWDVTA